MHAELFLYLSRLMAAFLQILYLELPKEGQGPPSAAALD